MEQSAPPPQVSPLPEVPGGGLAWSPIGAQASSGMWRGGIARDCVGGGRPGHVKGSEYVQLQGSPCPCCRLLPLAGRPNVQSGHGKPRLEVKECWLFSGASGPAGGGGRGDPGKCLMGACPAGVFRSVNSPGESAAHPTHTTEAQTPPPLLLPSHPTTPWACANMGTQGRGASGPEEEEEERTNSLISLPLISGEPCSPGTATRKGLEAYGRLRVPPWDSA